MVTLVRTRPEPTPASLTLLVIPTDAPGFRVRETLSKLGMHTSPTGWLELDHVRVPKRWTIGRPNLGYYYHTQNLLEERLIGGVASVAFARLALEATIDHLRGRMAYGQPLAELQVIRHRVAEMAAEVEGAERFVHSVCESFRDGRVEAKEICMIKFQVIDVVQRVADRCAQLHGAEGFMAGSWVGRLHRDVRVLSLGGGSSEVMKDLVAAYLRL
jgi:alkylation response protein AidB-like acyl-CoA dehydrogenase